MEKIYAIDPEIDEFQKNRGDLIKVVKNNSVAANLDYLLNMLRSKSNENDLPTLKYKFLLSFLIDAASCGASLFVHNTKLNLAWPNYTLPKNRERLKNHMIRLNREGKGQNILKYKSKYYSGDDKSLIELAKNGTVQAYIGDELFDSETTAREIFYDIVQTWSMPFRTREGRRKQMVFAIENDDFRVPLGIIEVGDPTLNDKSRDHYLGLNNDVFSENIKRDVIDPKLIKKKLLKLAKCLLLDYPGSEKKFIKMCEQNKGVLNSKRKEDLTDKPYIYQVRIGKSLNVINKIIKDQNVDKGALSELIKLYRDLYVSKVCCEISICGTMQPFNKYKFGKFISSLSGMRQIRDLVSRGGGSLLQNAFDYSKLKMHLPNYGALLVTTKGLYPFHSAQYNRVVIPSNDKKIIKFKKIGLTKGMTTNHISQQTHELSKKVLMLEENGYVSKVYGSGGGKRQRRLKNVFTMVGITSDRCSPYIPRPVYGFSAISNLTDVFWNDHKPTYNIIEDDSDYIKIALDNFRTKYF